MSLFVLSELTVRKLREKVKHLELEAENNVQASYSY